MTRDHLDFAREVSRLIEQAGYTVGPPYQPSGVSIQGSEALRFDVLDSSIPPQLAYRVYVTEPQA